MKFRIRYITWADCEAVYYTEAEDDWDARLNFFEDPVSVNVWDIIDITEVKP